jgi:hypothetical protein
MTSVLYMYNAHLLLNGSLTSCKKVWSDAGLLQCHFPQLVFIAFFIIPTVFQNICNSVAK